jgi:WD40 repeat protein
MVPSTPGSPPLSGALDLAGDRLLTAGLNGSADQLGDATVDLWDARSGRHLRSFDTHAPLEPQIPGTPDFSVQAMAFSPDGRQLALVGVDNHVELYQVSTGRQIGLLNPEGRFADSVAFSPDGQLLAIGTAASAYVWRLPSPSPLPEFHHADGSTYGFITGGTGVHVGFTKDSRVLMTVGDFALEAWSPLDGTQLFKAFAVRGALSPDGSQFVGTTINGVSTYPCELCGGLPELLAVARRHTTRDLTPAERRTYLTAG